MRNIVSLPLRQIQRGRYRCAKAVGWSCMALLAGGLLASSVWAQPTTPLHGAVLLVDAYADAPPDARPRGVFVQQTLAITLNSAQVRLASTPDGMGAICTDDQATLTLTSATGATRLWMYQFASPDRRAIVCRPPQTLALPAGAGTYTATITLEDLYPDTYGTRAYYLVADRAGAANTAQERRPMASGLADPTPAITHTPQPVASPRAILKATAVPSPVGSVVPAVVQRSDRAGMGLPIRDTRVLAAAGFILMLAILALIVWRSLRRRRLPLYQLRGVLYLFESVTREARTIALPIGMTEIAIYRQPLRAVPVRTSGGAGAAIARMQATARGPVLYEGEALNTQPIALERDRPYVIAGGEVTLRYHDQIIGTARGGPRASRAVGQRSRMR